MNPRDCKTIREILKYTQKEYAEYLSVDLRTIQNWESRGTGETTGKLLSKIVELQKMNNILKKRIEKQQLEFNLPK